MKNEKGNWPAVNKAGILRSVERTFTTRDSSNLTEAAYKFLYLLDGFIAHYDRGGFQHFYRDTSRLAKDILNSYQVRSPEHYTQDSFVRDYGAAYCESEAETARGLKTLAEKYLPELESYDDRMERDRDLAHAHALLAKHNAV